MVATLHLAHFQKLQRSNCDFVIYREKESLQRSRVLFAEIELSFPYRDVVIKRGVDPKQFYELETEIGR